jgi:hypothetical protein
MTFVKQPHTVCQVGDSRRSQQRQETPAYGTGLFSYKQCASHSTGNRRNQKRRY